MTLKQIPSLPLFKRQKIKEPTSFFYQVTAAEIKTRQHVIHNNLSVALSHLLDTRTQMWCYCGKHLTWQTWPSPRRALHEGLQCPPPFPNLEPKSEILLSMY